MRLGPTANRKRSLPRLLVDCDPGIDDSVALLLLSTVQRFGEIGLEAVTTVSGNVSVEKTTRNARFILDSGGLPQVPVYSGARRPLRRSGTRTRARSFHGPDGLGGCFTHLSDPTSSYDEAAGKIVRFLSDPLPGSKWILAIGPLTNLALALRIDPSISARADRVVVMGGAFGHPAGNITPWSEFNFHADPTAARIVMESGLSIELIPLDVTQQVVFRPADFTLGPPVRVPLAGCLIASSLRIHHRLLALDGCYLHDVLAAAVLLRPSLVSFARGSVDVNLDERPGQTTLVSPGKEETNSVAVALNVDKQRARLFVLDLLRNGAMT